MQRNNGQIHGSKAKIRQPEITNLKHPAKNHRIGKCISKFTAKFNIPSSKTIIERQKNEK